MPCDGGGWVQLVQRSSNSAVRVGWMQTGAERHEGMGVNGLRVPVQTICLRGWLVFCLASRNRWSVWACRGPEGGLQSAVQGRVSQNLRLIQVYFRTHGKRERMVCLRADQAQSGTQVGGESHSRVGEWVWLSVYLLQVQMWLV